MAAVCRPAAPPVSYQWQKNGLPIANATNANLVLASLLATNAGSYTVVVSDSASNAMTCNPANLSVYVAGVNMAVDGVHNAGLTMTGVTGQTYGIQASTNLSSWFGVTNITLTSPTQVWQDLQSAMLKQRYYRVVQGPISIP